MLYSLNHVKLYILYNAYSEADIYNKNGNNPYIPIYIYHNEIWISLKYTNYSFY